MKANNFYKTQQNRFYRNFEGYVYFANFNTVYNNLAGCPTDYSLMGVVQEVNGTGQVLHADFDAFKFPTSNVVQFRALVNAYLIYSLSYICLLTRCLRAIGLAFLRLILDKLAPNPWNCVV